VLDLQIEHLRLMVASVKKSDRANRALAAGVGTAGATVATLAAAAKLDFGALTGVCLASSAIVLVCSMLGRWGQPPRLGRRVRTSWGLEDEDPLAAAVATFKATDRETDEVFERKQANPLAVRDQLVIFLIAELNMEVYRAKRSASWAAAAYNILLLTLVLGTVGLATS